MTTRLRCTAVLVATALGTAVEAQQAIPSEPFAPFEPRAYRLVNSIAFSPDDQVMYFALLHREVLEHRGTPEPDAPVTALFRSRRTEGGWTEPELLPFSGRYQDYEATLTSDGRFMVFNSKRPYPDGRMPEQNDLWISRLGPRGWEEPERAAGITTFELEESYPSVSADRTLVFMRARAGPDGAIGHDLHTSTFSGGRHQPSTRHPASTDRWGEGDPFLAPDGSYLIFTRWDDAIGWDASTDLHISFRTNTGWSEPVPLVELNTDGPDFGAALSADGVWLYYRTDSRFWRTRMDAILERYRPG